MVHDRRAASLGPNAAASARRDGRIPAGVEPTNAMFGFQLRTFIADRDFTNDASLHLPERLDVLVAAVVTVLSRGIVLDARLTRIVTVWEGLRRGLTTSDTTATNAAGKCKLRQSMT